MLDDSLQYVNDRRLIHSSQDLEVKNQINLTDESQFVGPSSLQRESLDNDSALQKQIKGRFLIGEERDDDLQTNKMVIEETVYLNTTEDVGDGIEAQRIVNVDVPENVGNMSNKMPSPQGQQVLVDQK